MSDKTQTDPVCQMHIPFDVTPRKLPGINPLDPADWLMVDDAFDGQMARRDALIHAHPDDVLRMVDEARPAVIELLHTVLRHLAGLEGIGYRVDPHRVVRPDGVSVPVDWDRPLHTLGRLVQEDLCILEKHADEHVLTAAALCFPASWHLDEKFGRPLTAIHDPVDSYDSDIARRVQRLFDGVQPDRPMWRFNRLWYVDPELHQPRSIHARRPKPDGSRPAFFRCERQCILRLPETSAVVFSIHTFVTRQEDAPQAAFVG